MYPLTSLLVVLVAVATISSDESSTCPRIDATRQCICWNSNVRCNDLGVADLNFLQPLPVEYSRLFINHNNLQSVQESDLAAFANVTSLTMQFNRLLEFDFGDVKMSLLQSLDLSDNSLVRLKLNPSLKSLTSVILERNNLHFTERDFAFPNIIERLKMSKNRIGNNLTFLRHLANVKTLWLPENHISVISEDVFEKNVKLEYLRLDSNFISNINFLNHITSLKGLDLTNNRIEHIPLLTFQNMTNLVHLYLGKNKITNIEFVQIISKNLGTLILSNNDISQFSSATFKSKNGIKQLGLSYNKLSDLSFVSELQNLEILSADNNYINSISDYQFNKSRINFLNLSNNFIKNVGFVPHSRYIKYFSAADNKLSNINPNTFINSEMVDLDLSGNELRGLDFIRSIPTIKNLFVKKCNITNIPENIFRDNPALEKLDISENLIENLDFVFYGSQMRFLNISNCSIQSTDGSPLKCSRSVVVNSSFGNTSLSFIKSTDELWEKCYGKSIVTSQNTTRQWTVLTTITILSLVCLILLLTIILLETIIRFRRKRRNAYLEIENEVKKVQC